MCNGFVRDVKCMCTGCDMYVHEICMWKRDVNGMWKEFGKNVEGIWKEYAHGICKEYERDVNRIWKGFNDGMCTRISCGLCMRCLWGVWMGCDQWNWIVMGTGRAKGIWTGCARDGYRMGTSLERHENFMGTEWARNEHEMCTRSVPEMCMAYVWNGKGMGTAWERHVNKVLSNVTSMEFTRNGNGTELNGNYMVMVWESNGQVIFHTWERLGTESV